MDNKLSELSKPVAWVFKDANDVDHASITKKANLYGRHDFQPLYSQEYVSALDEIAQYWIGQSYEWKQRAESAEAKAEALLAELEASKKSNVFLKEQLAQLANFNPDWDMLEACRESWREVAAALKEAEAYNAKLRDWNAGLAQESCELQAKLATPVRLPVRQFYDGSDKQVCILAGQFNAAIDKSADGVRAAGFTVGDE
ncbi:hypothetical protein [Serratia quinivorans]|uniref:hypothetical protein n=1 Tax=Serratia quinivorans TaxID=137545 RepID=UPI0021797097|nr:hypothetical protein [Serratia quinivorans]CAI1110229.1 Uncharacterised protein [Serratia quinivorans]